MEFVHNVARTLHDEHLAAMGLLNRMNDVFLSQSHDAPPDVADITTRNLLGDIGAAISSEISGHFDFEEEDLFPLLVEAGEGGIGELLVEEHRIIVPIGDQLVAHTKQARLEGFTTESWTEFRRLVAEFIERLGAHIHKEETGLVPLLDDILDEDTDRDLSNKYALSR